jgi:starch-binding outer membrane protein, SusD/RagB family
MRKHTVALLGAALLAGVPACVNLDEDVVTGLTPGSYGTQAVFESLVNASYEPLRSFYAQERGFTVTEFGTDIFTKGADGSFKYINDYTTQLNPDAQYFRETWVDFYRAINTANAALDQAPIVTMDSTLKARRVAEARFLRALYYFDLVQMFGPVTLTLHETRSPTTIATRTPVDSVYDAITEDLTYAEANLPAVQSAYGRATKGAAQHLLAKVYLTRIRDADSTADELAKRQAGDFANAADYAQRVINSGQYTLLARFKDVFDFANERNQEIIWSIQYTTDPLTTGNGSKGHLYFLAQYDVQPGMLRDVANGRPFKRFRPTWYFLGLFDRSKDARYDAQFTRVWYANNAATIPKDAQGVPKFALGDTAVYIATTDADSVLAGTKPYTVFRPRACCLGTGAPRPWPYEDNMFPSLNKFNDPFRSSVNEERGSRDFFVARLAETELIAAEALLRDGRPAEGLDHMNRVRRRAAIPGHETEMELTVGQLTLDEILNERARELTGEMQRWFDLVRTHSLVSRVLAYNPDAKPNIKPFHVLRPIPQIQIDRTSNPYPQNPGY